jgi:RNA-binding protein
MNDPKPTSSTSPTTPTTLHGAAIRHLRALGHPLQPVLHVGKEGITDALVTAANAAILKHELIKVKVLPEAPVDREAAANELASRTESVMAQVLGRTFLLYKRHPQKPKITLPKKPPPGALS